MVQKRGRRGVELNATLRAAREGVSLDLDVVPGSAESLFPAGYNPWRKRIEAKVRAPPEDGRANAELAELVADFFGVPRQAVALTSGATSRRKTLAVRGLDEAAAAERFRAWSG